MRGRRGPSKATVGGVVLLTALAGLVAVDPPAAASPTATASPTAPFVSVLIGRSLWTQAITGVPVPGQPTLDDVAARFAERAVRATGVVVPARTPETGTNIEGGNVYPSWETLGRLRDQYGWTFVSNGQQRLDVTTLPPADQIAETCGSLAAFEAHGHTRAWGLYGPGSNHITDDIATQVVGTCFAFSRVYDDENVNDRVAVTSPPYYARTNDTNGGECNLESCSGISGLAKHYMLPSTLIAEIDRAGADQWVVLSTYKLLTGEHLDGNRRWDCTATDVRAHWTSEIESYCLDDFLSVLDAIRPDMTVTDPATVAEAWDRVPGPPQLPAVSVGDRTVLEGATGTVALSFPIALSAPSTQTVTVRYATVDGTAEALTDYGARSGTVTFAPGQIARAVAVAVNGDITVEAEETVLLELDAAAGATVADGVGVGTIRNDDAVLTVSDASTDEGDRPGSRSLAFTMSLVPALDVSAKVMVTTDGGTATAGVDYRAKSVEVSFAAGVTSKTVYVVVDGDRVPEPDETVTLCLTSAVRALPDRPSATGTIRDDDGP